MNRDEKDEKPGGFRFGDPAGRGGHRGPRPEAPKEDAPQIVEKVRSKHGTRVARSIICTQCGAEDTIHFSPRDKQRVLCRQCAADKWGLIDAEANIRPEQRLQCTSCKRHFATTWTEPETFECNDCKKGIETVQGNRTGKAKRVSGKVLRVRRKEPKDS